MDNMGCSKLKQPTFAWQTFDLVKGYSFSVATLSLTDESRVVLQCLPLQVALRACEYARERCLYVETFIVSLQDKTTGAPITTLKEVAARIANVFGISKQVRAYVCVA